MGDFLSLALTIFMVKFFPPPKVNVPIIFTLWSVHFPSSTYLRFAWVSLVSRNGRFNGFGHLGGPLSKPCAFFFNDTFFLFGVLCYDSVLLGSRHYLVGQGVSTVDGFKSLGSWPYGGISIMILDFVGVHFGFG